MCHIQRTFKMNGSMGLFILKSSIATPIYYLSLLQALLEILGAALDKNNLF